MRLREPVDPIMREPACRSCGRKVFGYSEVCRSRKYPEYSRVWAGDQRQKLFANLREYGGQILLSAVTAPGRDQLPWDEDVCAGLGEHEHSGMLGCRVRNDVAVDWNQTAPDRWRRLHRRAYQETVKRCGKGSVKLVARVWEIQPRGVLHVHPVVGYGTALQMAGARCYLNRLAVLAPHYGFGFVHHRADKVKPQAAEGAAAYLSSYFVRGSGRKMAIWESVTSGIMPVSIVHVSSELTQASHCTMRTLRLKRALHAVWGAAPTMREVALVARFIQTFPGNVELGSLQDAGRPPPTPMVIQLSESFPTVRRWRPSE